jgi:hypothetical protein
MLVMVPVAVTGTSRRRNRLNHHGRIGAPPITKFLVGAVREPLLRVEVHG